MFAQPTIDDFRRRIDWHLNKATENCRHAIKSIDHKAAAGGWYRSGARIIQIFQAAETEFDKGVAAALGELKRVTLMGVLDMWELRRITEERARDFMASTKALTKPEQLKEFGPHKKIDEMIAKFDERLQYALRQFDIGFEDVATPEEPQVTNNSIQIASMYGGGIQQGTTHSSQSLSAKLEIDAAHTAINTLEVELSKSPESDQIAELKADLATIKAQLQKPVPNGAILTEAGKSVRSIAEGIVAGMMTSRAIQSVSELVRALGLS